MSTSSRFIRGEIGKNNPLFSMARVTIETAFYGNNVIPVFPRVKPINWLRTLLVQL